MNSPESPLYLSRLVLNPKNRGARREVAVPYELHRTLARPVEHLADPHLLFRIEAEPAPDGPIVLVQSAAPPDWQPLLSNGYLLRADGPRAYAPALTAGQILRFRLLANPVKKVGDRRIPLKLEVARDERETTYWDWLHRRAGLGGFEVLPKETAALLGPDGRRHRPDPEAPRPIIPKQEIPHFGVRFDGMLRVTDPARLSDTLRNGIGTAKAFGFGLLSLAPA